METKEQADLYSAAEQISVQDSADQYGIVSEHTHMPNGELRFRLMSANGYGYIQTIASSAGAWQNGHYHKKLSETYIVQSGWIGVATLGVGKLEYRKVVADEVVTIRPNVSHNIYLPRDAVLHTVKHGECESGDWHFCEQIDNLSKTLDERTITESQTITHIPTDTLDPRFNSYMNLYNNLDSIIWKVPSFLGIAIALIIGFTGSVLNAKSSIFSPNLWAIALGAACLISWLGSYAMYRLRIHHSLVGDELALMESAGYFRIRQAEVRRKYPLSAPHLFVLVFSFLGIVFLTGAILMWLGYQPLINFLKG